MFPNTQWTELARATLHGEATGRAAMDALCRSYWEPVRQYILLKGWPPADAPDLAQSFFLYLMERGVLHQADREKGRFRSFLQGILNNFLLTERQRRLTQKRGGRIHTEELTDDLPDPASDAHATAQFDKHWAHTIVQAALQRLAAECTAKKGEDFYATIAVFIGAPGTLIPQEQAAARLGLHTATFRTEIFTWRGKFREHLRAEVRRTVSAPHEVDSEMRYLWQLLTAT